MKKWLKPKVQFNYGPGDISFQEKAAVGQEVLRTLSRSGSSCGEVHGVNVSGQRVFINRVR